MYVFILPNNNTSCMHLCTLCEDMNAASCNERVNL